MSDSDYIKAACAGCQGRISLPIEAVGVDFNCPHCGVDLQMLLKHTCEHCGGRLSFDDNPAAIGVEIQCGHCSNQTVLAPSTFIRETADAAQETEEYDEDYEDEYEEEEEDLPKGLPKPRAPKRGLPKPRDPREGNVGGEDEGGSAPGQPGKMGRTLAGAGAKPAAEEEASSGGRKRPRPKRKGGPGGARGGAGGGATKRRRRPAPGSQPEQEPEHPAAAVPQPEPQSQGIGARRLAGSTPAEPEADPLAGAAPSGAPGPVQRKVAGSLPQPGEVAGGLQPTFQVAKGLKKKGDDDEDAEDGPWYKNKEKIKLAVVGSIFVLMFLPFGLPNVVELISAGSGDKVRYYTKLEFLFAVGDSGTTRDVTVDPNSMRIAQDEKSPGVYYVYGNAQNISSKTFEQVELHFELYDANGKMLGASMDFTNKLGPSMTWTFRAACMFTNVNTAKLVQVNVR
jgi:hypothetical protein